MEQVSGSSFSALTILGFLDVDEDEDEETVVDLFDMVLSISIKIDSIKFYILIYESTPFTNLLLIHCFLFDRRRNSPFIS